MSTMTKVTAVAVIIMLSSCGPSIKLVETGQTNLNYVGVTEYSRAYANESYEFQATLYNLYQSYAQQKRYADALSGESGGILGLMATVKKIQLDGTKTHHKCRTFVCRVFPKGRNLDLEKWEFKFIDATGALHDQQVEVQRRQVKEKDKPLKDFIGKTACNSCQSSTSYFLLELYFSQALWYNDMSQIGLAITDEMGNTKNLFWQLKATQSVSKREIFPTPESHDCTQVLQD